MKEEDKLETIKRYNERLAQFGYSEEALGWSRSKNDIRFKALTIEWDLELNNSRVGDFGCGFGDLYGFLQNTGKQVKYTGIDINANLIELGRKLYPNAEFWVGDIVKDQYVQKFDFIFSSGVFNHKLKNGNEYSFIQECLEKLNELSIKGFAVNFLSDKVDYQLAHTFHSNPGKILDIMYKFSKHVVLRNDYMPFEFTVYIRKDAEIDPAKVIFK